MFLGRYPTPVFHLEGDREFADSPVEESGFEPLVPLTLNQANAGEREEKIAMSPLRCIG
jgi:hypothetical protein